MDIAQIALLVGGVNLAVLAAGAVVALARAVGRRRHQARRTAERRTSHPAN